MWLDVTDPTPTLEVGGLGLGIEPITPPPLALTPCAALPELTCSRLAGPLAPSGDEYDSERVSRESRESQQRERER